MLEFIGYLGVVIIGVSLVQKNRFYLHLLNAVGSAVMGVYSVIIKDTPFLVLEIGIVALNLYYMWQMKKNDPFVK